ncbi:MAG: hypothetical protein JW808_07850 [Victivallales bacterium]|nr:hypothetical protein [Victivallales bacterium]
MKRLALCTLAFIAAIGLNGGETSTAEMETDGGTTYMRTGNTYTVKHVFQSSSEMADLLSICFDFKHLEGYVRHQENPTGNGD